tara:strand:+ start:1289 stop:1456 length:168 start_codon:yes stop_codon:yes gene_type:complete
MTSTTYSKNNSDIFVIVREDLSFTIMGMDYEFNVVTDEEILQLAEATIPTGWEVV